MMETSLRADVAHAGVPEYVIPKPGVAYTVDDNDPEHQLLHRTPAIRRLQEALGR
jgi:hypothetical protein